MMKERGNMIITLSLTSDIIIVVAIVMILFIVLWYGLTMKRLYQLNVRICEAQSGIDVALEKRIHALVTIIAAICVEENIGTETLSSVYEWHKGIPQNATFTDKARLLKQLNTIADNILNITKESAKSKINTDSEELTIALNNSQIAMQMAIRHYNALVIKLNKQISSFPQNIVANAIQIDKHPYFTNEDTDR